MQAWGHSGGSRLGGAPVAGAAEGAEGKEARQGDGGEVAARARRGGRRLFLSAGLASSRQDRWQGASLHTPGPAPPSAGFSSLKAPGSLGRCPFPARPPTARPLGLGAPPQVGDAVAARRVHHTV